MLEAELVAAEESRAEESAVAGELRVQLAESLELHGEQMQAAAAAAAAELWEVGVSHTVRALPRQLRTLAFPTVNMFCVARLYGRDGRVTARNGGIHRARAGATEGGGDSACG